MTWRADLSSTLHRVRRKVDKLERAYREDVWRQQPVASTFLGSLVVELDNLCVDALREFALGTIRGCQAGGAQIRRIGRRPIQDDEYSALALEALRFRSYDSKRRPLAIPRRDEPTVRNPVQIGNIFALAGVPVQQDFVNAVGLNFGVFSQLKIPRHYYAHRNQSTVAEIISAFGLLRLGPNRNPDEVLHFRSGTAREPQFLEWTAEVRTFFEVAIP